MSHHQSVHLRLIGDVHGYIQEHYIRSAQCARYSIQLGDMGFNYVALNQLDSQRHLFLGGNHDNYTCEETERPLEEATKLDVVKKRSQYAQERVFKFTMLPEHFMGHFGVWTVPECEGNSDIFFVRGAQSVDRMYRIPGVSWWTDEQLTISQFEEAVQLYSEVKPDFVISHECPYVVHEAFPSFLGAGWGGQGVIRNHTAQALQVMWQCHQPKLWVFAHYHKPLWEEFQGTTFICLESIDYPESTLDFDDKLNIIA